ncbi:LysR family transcriptional regulator [Actinomadura kijaniata]|uniref:LysR family transcriptional regulator n=1 Tax=Actinomadura kijaniata TaxID=46161 RepID=UPI00083723AA|nr:LysR family transcriptional regulator [Actinomadura kijaniata]
MNLDHFRSLVALAEELHFARAAQRCGLSQPQLSRQVRRVEEELGVLLFERTTREVRITPAGEAFVAEARRSLEHADRAVLAARRLGRGESGRLVVGFVGSAAHTLLPPVLRRFRDRYPGVELDLRELPSARQAEELAEGTLDVGVLYAPVHQDGLETRELFRGRLLAALPRTHPHAHRDPLPLSALADEGFVLFPRELGTALHAAITRAARAAGFEVRVVQEAVQMQTIVGLVAAGIGVSIVPWAVAAGSRRDDVVFRRLSPDVHGVSLHLAWRRGDPNPAVRGFRSVAPRPGADAGRAGQGSNL